MPTPSTDLVKGQEVVDWLEKQCVHSKGEWAGQPLTLEPWQSDEIVKPLFGTLRPDGLRQYRTALIGIPRKAGKTTLGAALALRLLFRDGEQGAEIFSAAADREQARLCFEIGRGMVEANPMMSKIARVYRNSIVVPRTGSSWKVLSAEAYSKHGLNPHGVIFDELHAQADRELWDVLTTGQGARRQPLTIAITTAGYDRESICYELYEYGRRIQAGIVDDPTFFFRWWGVLEDQDWEDEAVWAQAQPNLGVSVNIDFMRSEARQAKQLPARQNTFRRLYLNEWTQAQSRWLDLGAWDASAGLVDEQALQGKTCFGGLDLASSKDVAALCWTFPEEDGFQVLWRFWLPEEQLPSLDRRTAGQGSVWVKQGWLKLTQGNVIDYEAILSQMDRDARAFDIKDVGYDRWGMSQLSTMLQDAGLEIFPFAQTITALSPGTKELERLVLDGKYHHGGNPVMRWMADNVVTATDSSGNIKPDKKKSTEKIDGVVAAVMALDRALRHEGPTSSVYENRGLLVL